eukprot:736895-Prymnesium_polylepis.1
MLGGQAAAREGRGAGEAAAARLAAAGMAPDAGEGVLSHERTPRPLLPSAIELLRCGAPAVVSPRAASRSFASRRSSAGCSSMCRGGRFDATRGGGVGSTRRGATKGAAAAAGGLKAAVGVFAAALPWPAAAAFFAAACWRCASTPLCTLAMLTQSSSSSSSYLTIASAPSSSTVRTLPVRPPISTRFSCKLPCWLSSRCWLSSPATDDAIGCNAVCIVAC